ncbi:hairy-related 3 [Betta splendens]|uniref:Hairy-related 3 n=1 Tax=Betta splendens TaxID=158456 RepID=A0A6P7N0S3_BETSP|nr:hairy-related 3 [Betta splendens]
MVASTDLAEQSKPTAGNRVSKPLMEKKRRARINKSLDQLKSLLESYYSSNIRKRKLEKADILELTVKHLRNLQKIQSCAAAHAASEFSEYQFGFRGCLANVNQYLLMADNLNGSDRWMLSQLSSKLRRSLGPHEASSTMDSGLDRVETRDEARRLLASDAGPEERNTSKSNVTNKSRCLSEEAQQSMGNREAAAPAQHPHENSSSCKTFHSADQGHEEANTQYSVWRPW